MLFEICYCWSRISSTQMETGTTYKIRIFLLHNKLNLIFVSQEFEEDQQYLQFCTICDGYKAPRVHHCHKCNNLKHFKLSLSVFICSKIFNIGNRCVLKMDHHCPWLNTCVGHANHPSFVIFIFVSIVASIQSSTLLLRTLLLVLA